MHHFREVALTSLSFRSTCVVASVVLLPMAFLSGCLAKEAAKPVIPPPPVDFTQPLPEGEVALRKISPEQYPDFSKSLGSANVDDLRESAKNSLIWLGKASSAK